MSRTLSMPENLLLTHWLAEILNAAHIMYYQTVIDENTKRLTTGEYGILECQTVIDVKYSTPDNWRAIIIRLKSVVRRLVSTDVLEICLLSIPVPRSHASILYPFCPQSISDVRYRIDMTQAYEYISVSRALTCLSECAGVSLSPSHSPLRSCLT